MEYLHKFTTQAACDAYVQSDDYKEPFTALVDATSAVSYNIAMITRIDVIWDGTSWGSGPSIEFAKNYCLPDPSSPITQLSGCPIYYQGVQIPYADIGFSGDRMYFYYYEAYPGEQEKYRYEAVVGASTDGFLYFIKEK